MTTPHAEVLDTDSSALSAAGSAAEEALALHRTALAILGDGWGGESGSAATDMVRRQCGAAADLVEALHGAAAELRALRETLSPVGEGSDGVDVLPGPLDDHPDYAQASARLNDRAAPTFDSPEPPLPPSAPAGPAPAAPALTAWPSGMSSLPNLGSGQFPNLGGALGALFGQVADAVSADRMNADGVSADGGSTDAVAVRAERPAPSPAEPPTPAGLSPLHGDSPAPTPAGIATSEPEMVVPQQQNVAPLPLLAAELPPPQSAAPAETPPAEVPQAAAESSPAPAPVPSVDTRTPCEIAADELPQVGQ